MPAMAQLSRFNRLLCATVFVVSALGVRASPAEPLRLVTEISLGPYEHLEDDKAPGFSVEVLRQVFAAMGQDASFEAFPEYRSWMMIARGERDGGFSTPRISDLERICLFPDEPLKQERWVMFVRTADIQKLKFTSFDDLVGHDVAVRGTTPGLFDQPIAPELWKFLSEHHNMVETPGSLVALRMLAAGRVDYAVVNLSSGMRDIAAMGLSGRIEPLLSHSVADNGFYICFTKTRVEPDFVAAFSLALKQFKQTEEFQKIYRKYFP
jgi:polar amino acid transport system substrate-binding protein